MMPPNTHEGQAGVSLLLLQNIVGRSQAQAGRGAQGGALTCQAERAENKLGAVQDGKAAVFLLADSFGTLKVLGVLPWADFLDFHDIHYKAMKTGPSEARVHSTHARSHRPALHTHRPASSLPGPSAPSRLQDCVRVGTKLAVLGY